ncbi:MAG: LCP family protein [Anaerolineales bacterium]|jgi:LCP family protein required for cell wall assembly
MKKYTLWVVLSALLLVTLTCKLQEEAQPTPNIIQTTSPSIPPTDTLTSTPNTLPNTDTPTITLPFTDTPSFTPSPTLGPPPTATLGFIPAPTSKKWPTPYFGTPGPTQVTPIPKPAPVIHEPDTITLLLLGSDKRTKSFRTDTMVVVTFQPEYHLITLLSIPRDLYVYIPGWKMERINAAFQHGESGYYHGGGPALVKDTLLYNLGIEVDYYAIVEFSGFKNIIDIFGGVDVPVVCPYTDLRPISPEYDFNDKDHLYLFTIEPGVVHMDGELTMWYIRARKKSSDFDRNRRQQEMLRAMYSQALRMEMIGKIPELYEEISQSIKTDFTLLDALILAPQIFDLPSSQVRSFFISRAEVNPWTTPQKAAVQIPDQQALYYLVRQAFNPPDETEQSRVDLVVEIWNGTPAYGWEVLASERLHYAGYDAAISVADRSNYSQTLIFDYTEDQDSKQAGNLLELFELDESRLIKNPDPSYPYDYKVVLGSDYDPCFRPKDIQR